MKKYVEDRQAGKKINVLFVNPFWKPYFGGIERTILELSIKLKTRNEIGNIGILTSYGFYPTGKNKQLPKNDVSNGIKVYRLNFFPQPLPPNLGSTNGGIFAFGIKNVLEDFKPDVIHFMTNYWCFPNLIIRSIGGDKYKYCYSLIYHDIAGSVIKRLFFSPIILVNRYLTKKVDIVHVLTDVERQFVSKAYKIPFAKLKIISLGMNTPRNNYSRNAKTVTILCVGRLEPGKGQYNLLEIYTKIIKNTSIKTKLVFVGGDGGDELKLRNYVFINKLENTVEILGFVSDEDLDVLYRKSDIFVLLSNYEAFGLVFTEALSYKLPVIAYKVGALSEVLKESAILIPPFNTELVYKHLIKLIENKKLRLKIGINGYNYVKKIYSWEITADKFVKLYKEILQ